MIRLILVSRSRAVVVSHAAVAAIVMSALALGGCDRAAQSPIGSAPQSPEPTPMMLSQSELAATYSNLSALVAEARTDDVWKRFRAEQDALVTVVDNRLQIEVTGEHPVLILPPFGPAGHRFIVEAVIDSPKATTARMLYMVKGQNNYGPSQTQTVALQPGRNVVYFRFDNRSIIDPLRLDPAATPGLYVIESLRAMELPPAPLK